MPIVNAIDAGALIQAFRQGQSDRMTLDKTQRAQEREARVSDARGRLFTMNDVAPVSDAGGFSAPPLYQDEAPQLPGALGKRFGTSMPALAPQSVLRAQRPSRFGVPVTSEQQQDLRDDGVISAANADTLSAAPASANPKPEQLVPEHVFHAIDRAQGNGWQLNKDALRDLLHEGETDTVVAVLKMDNDQRKAALEQVGKSNAVVSSIVSAVRQLPEPERESAYQAIRHQYDGLGMRLPEKWDEGMADYYQRVGLTAQQALTDARADRRLDWDIEDDEEDNARADRNTGSLISDRRARRDIATRGQDLTDARVRRGQNIASTDRQRGQDQTEKRARDGIGGGGRPRSSRSSSADVVQVQTPEEARNLPAGTMFRTPDGRVKVR